jgi:hypothetical protein
LVAEPDEERTLVTVIPQQPEQAAAAEAMAMSLRQRGVSADFAYRGNIKRRDELWRKSRSKSRLVISAHNESFLVRLNSPGSADAVDTGLEDRVFSALQADYIVNLYERKPSGELGFSIDAMVRRRSNAE